jgi:hypothetical protein
MSPNLSVELINIPDLRSFLNILKISYPDKHFLPSRLDDANAIQIKIGRHLAINEVRQLIKEFLGDEEGEE